MGPRYKNSGCDEVTTFDYDAASKKLFKIKVQKML